MTRALALILLGACAPAAPIVTGGGTSEDGRTAWFAVSEGGEVTFYRCEGAGCVVVPRANARGTQPAESEDAASEDAAATQEPEATTEEAAPAEDESGYPDEERMDLMDGVF